jgi:cytosine permease
LNGIGGIGVGMNKEDHEFSLTAVPQSHRMGFWKMFVLMVGFTFSTSSMLSGGTLGLGLSMTEFILLVLAGNLILGIYTGSLAYVASKTGLSTHLLTRYTFGEKGSYLPSFLLSGTQVGWFGVVVAMFALSLQRMTGLNTYLLIGIAGILMTATAYYGIKALAILSFVAVPAITVLGSFSSLKSIDSMGGFQAIMQYEPTETIGMAAALTICVGSFISGGTLTPDFTRFAHTKRSAVISTVAAFFLGNTLMFVFGFICAFATGKSDISEVMFLQGLIVPALIVLGLNIWTTNDNSLYAAGLGFSNITKIRKDKLVVVSGILGTVLAMWLYNNFVGWLGLVSSTLPPIGAIILVDYFLLNRGNYKHFATMKFKTVNWPAIAAWAAGVGFAKLGFGIPPLNALIGSAAIYLVITLVAAKVKATNPIERIEEVGKIIIQNAHLNEKEELLLRQQVEKGK